MDHWRTHLFPQIKCLLEDKSPLSDLAFICKDGAFHSFRVLFKGLPDLGLIPEPRVVLLLPDTELSEIELLHDSLLGEVEFVEEELIYLLRPLGLLTPALDCPRNKPKRKRPPRVPLIKNKCDLCQKKFSSAQALKNHISVHAEERPFPCYVCSKSFVTKSVLEAHARRHNAESGDKALQPCPHCPSFFNSKSNLLRHIRALHFEHSDKNTFLCQDCGKSFVDPSALNAHQKIHSGTRPHVCSDCGKAFLTPANLMIHRRTHTGERPYSCGTCNKSFVTSSQLKSHKHPHLGSDPETLTARKAYKCKLCKEVVQYYSVDSHWKKCAINRRSSISLEEANLSRDDDRTIVERNNYNIEEEPMVEDLWLSS